MTERWRRLLLMPSGPVTRVFTIKLPRLYVEDTQLRELDVGVIVGRTHNTITLRCTHDQLWELASDADYYTDPIGFDPEVKPVCRSAARALELIKAAQGDD